MSNLAEIHCDVRQFRSDVSWRGHTHDVLQHIERTQTALLGADSMRRDRMLRGTGIRMLGNMTL